MKVLKIYSRTCGPCKVLESNLQLAGIPHESIDVQSIQDNVVKRHSGLLGVQELKEFCNETN